MVEISNPLASQTPAGMKQKNATVASAQYGLVQTIRTMVRLLEVAVKALFLQVKAIISEIAGR